MATEMEPTPHVHVDTAEKPDPTATTTTTTSPQEKAKPKRRRRRALYSAPKKRKSTSTAAAKKSKATEKGESAEKPEPSEPAAKKHKESTAEKEEHPRSPRKHEKPSETRLSHTASRAGESLGEKGDVSLLEKGKIFFCYRPKVEHTYVDSWQDVGKFYMILEPTESAAEMKNRMIVIGNKKLPVAGQRRGLDYAIVTDAEEEKADLAKDLEPTSYDTKTRGERHVSGARIAAAGLYELAITEKGNTHLAYVINQPEREHFGEAQRVFNIEVEGEFAIQVRNPYQLANKRTEREGLADKGKGAHFPQEFRQKYFQGKTKELRWAKAMPELLNYAKCEMLLVGAHKDLKKLEEYGSDLEYESDVESEKLHRMAHPDEKVYKDLGLPHDTRPEEHPNEPLAEGKLA